MRMIILVRALCISVVEKSLIPILDGSVKVSVGSL